MYINEHVQFLHLHFFIIGGHFFILIEECYIQTEFHLVNSFTVYDSVCMLLLHHIDFYVLTVDLEAIP
jgi:hypothetical protein